MSLPLQMADSDIAEHSMLDGNVGATFLRYGIRWTLGFLALSSAGVVDGLFIGRYVGAMALASRL